jgi:hypothetical protein
MPGSSETSLLYLRLVSSDYGLQMPPTGPLGDAQVRIVKAWIDQGADWPNELAGAAPPPPPPTDEGAALVMDALRNGDHHAVKRIVSQNPKVTSMKGAGGSTPLMFATLYGNVDDVRFLRPRRGRTSKTMRSRRRSCGHSTTSRRRGCCWSMEPIPTRGPRLAERLWALRRGGMGRAQLSRCCWIIAPVWWCQPTSTPSACRYRPQHTPPMTPSFGCSSIVAPI